MTGIAKWRWMLKICDEAESPKEKACLRYIIELVNNMHMHDRMSGPSNSKTFQSRTFKFSNSQTFELETRRTFELSISTRVKPSNFANFKSVEISNSRTFIPFKLSISETFNPSNLKPFEVWSLRTLKLATSATSRRSNLKPTFQTPNLQTCELSNFQAFVLSKFETVEYLKVQTSKVSNSQTSKADRTRPRQKFEVWVWSSQSSSKVRELERLKVWKFRVWKVRSLTPASLCIPRCTNFRTPALFGPSNLQNWSFLTSTSKLSNLRVQTTLLGTPFHRNSGQNPTKP